MLRYVKYNSIVMVYLPRIVGRLVKDIYHMILYPGYISSWGYYDRISYQKFWRDILGILYHENPCFEKSYLDMLSSQGSGYKRSYFFVENSQKFTFWTIFIALLHMLALCG